MAGGPGGREGGDVAPSRGGVMERLGAAAYHSLRRISKTKQPAGELQPVRVNDSNRSRLVGIDSYWPILIHIDSY